MVHVDTDAVCNLALLVNAKVPNFYRQSFTTYSSSHLFGEIVNGMVNVNTELLHVKDLYQDAFGTLSLHDLLAAVANLDHSRRNTAEKGVAMVLSGLTLVVVGLRLYSRLAILTGRLRLEDYFIIAGTVLAMAVQAVNWICVSDAGFGKHFWDVSQMETVVALKMNFLVNIFFNIAMLFVKFAFLIFYRTLSNARAFQWTCFGLAVVILAGTVAIVFATVFSCIPVNIWDHADDIWESCTNIAARIFFQAGFSIVTDIAILALPLSLIPSLKIFSRKEKFALIGFFVMGGLVCIVSIVRTLQVDPYERSPDWTWHGPMFMFWHVVEVDLSIMVNSAPALKPLIMTEVNRVRDIVSTSRSMIAHDDVEGNMGAAQLASPTRPNMPRRQSSRRGNYGRQEDVGELDEGPLGVIRPISDISKKAISPMPSIPDSALGSGRR